MAKQPRKIAEKKREYSRPSMEKMLVVNSEGLITGVETYVNKTMSSLYALDVILFYIGDNDLADMANDKAADSLEKKLEIFNKRIAKYKHMSQQCDDFKEAEYQVQISRTYKIYSPLCSIYLNLIQKAELITNLIDGIWLVGGMKSKVRNERVRNLSTEMRVISHELKNISENAMKVARNKGEETAKAVDETIKSIIETNNTNPNVSEENRPQLKEFKDLKDDGDDKLTLEDTEEELESETAK
jgi:hypothetical protein